MVPPTLALSNIMEKHKLYIPYRLQLMVKRSQLPLIRSPYLFVCLPFRFVCAVIVGWRLSSIVVSAGLDTVDLHSEETRANSPTLHHHAQGDKKIGILTEIYLLLKQCLSNVICETTLLLIKQIRSCFTFKN